MFNKVCLDSTFYIYIQQDAFSFNFNPNYFYSTTIFVQLQPKLFSFNKNNYSTSTTNNIIQQQYLFNFNPNYLHSTKIIIQLQPKIISFNNKVPSLLRSRFLGCHATLPPKNGCEGDYKVPGHPKFRHSTKFPFPPLPLYTLCYGSRPPITA